MWGENFTKLEIEEEEEKEKTERLAKDIVSKFVRDVSDGYVSLRVDIRHHRPEDVELVGNAASKLILYLNDYLMGVKAGEELEVLERQLSFCISVLETFGALKRTSTREENEEIKKLDSKINSAIKRLDQLTALIENRPIEVREIKQLTDLEEVSEEDLI